MLKFTYTHTSFKFIGFSYRFNRHWISCQKHRYIYIYLICILDSIHMQHASKLFKYHVFVFTCVLKKSDFHFKNSSFRNTDFVFKPNFNITKMVQIICNMCWILVTHICIFFEIYVILWDLIEIKKTKF